MTTASTNTVIDHTGDAGFRTWVAEVIAQLLAVGLTQTADTGQINTATVTRPGTNTSGGYAIFRFNDTAHSTSPVFFKLEFGTGSSANNPMMWITVGTGSNGSGTINGTVLTRRACLTNQTPSSTITPYTSRWVYNTTLGVCGMCWKINSVGTPTASMGGFYIYRSTDSSGAVTTDAVGCITNSSGSTGTTSSAGYVEFISYLNSTAYTTTPFPSNRIGFIPYLVTVSLYSSNSQVFPVFQYTPVLGISNSACIAIQNEIAMGSTITLALIGSTTHTYIQVGSMFGSTSWGNESWSSASYGFMMLWE